MGVVCKCGGTWRNSVQTYISAATLFVRRFLEVTEMDSKKQAHDFPLDFNAVNWTLEEVVRWVFFCSTPTPESLAWRGATKYVMAKLADPDVPMKVLLSEPTKTVADSLLRFFRRLSSDWQSDLELPPVVWSRLAIQYWLTHGGRQDLFMKEFLFWLKNVGNVVVTIEPMSLDGKNIGGAKLKEMDLAIFVFDPINLKRAIQRRVVFKAIGLKKSGGATTSKGKAKSIEAQLGSNLYKLVKSVVEDAIQSGCISNLSSRRDPKSGRYQFTGRHDDLCKDIYCQYRKDTERYSKSTLERAIRALVASRRSWKGIV